MMLIQTAKLNGIEPMAWLTDVLECWCQHSIPLGRSRVPFGGHIIALLAAPRRRSH